MEFNFEVVKWAYREGISLLVVLLLLYYIKERDKSFKVLIEDNTKAFRSNTLVTHEVSNALREQAQTMRSVIYGIRRPKNKNDGPGDFETDS